MGEKREREFDEKRLYRRRRRIRNQIMAYITVGIFFAAIVVGVVLGVQKLMGFLAEGNGRKKWKGSWKKWSSRITKMRS